MTYDDECQHCGHARVMHPMGHACIQSGCRCQTFEKPVFQSPKCRHCGHAKVMHVYGRLCDHDRCKCLIFRPPAVRSTRLDRCTCGHISDNHLSSGTCLLGGCYCTHFEYPEMCICGHKRTDHTAHGGYCRECTSERARYYCASFRSTTPEPERCSTAPFKITETTGDTTMSDITYAQATTLKNALAWMAAQVDDSDSPLTWAEMSVLPAREIVARYAQRQRDILAELAALTALMDSPVSESVASLHNDAYRFTRDQEKAERELRNAEILLSFTTPDEPATVTETVKTYTVTVTETETTPGA